MTTLDVPSRATLRGAGRAVSSRIRKDVLPGIPSRASLPGSSAKRKQIYGREKRETNGIVLRGRSVNDTWREGNRKLEGTRLHIP